MLFGQLNIYTAWVEMQSCQPMMKLQTGVDCTRKTALQKNMKKEGKRELFFHLMNRIQ